MTSIPKVVGVLSCGFVLSLGLSLIHNFTREEHMSTIEKSIEVNVPVHTAYNQWTQFEEFPRFMEGGNEVRQLVHAILIGRLNSEHKNKHPLARGV